MIGRDESEPPRKVSSSASSDQLLQFLGVHPRKPWDDPVPERKRMSAKRISTMSEIKSKNDISVHHSHHIPGRERRFHRDLHPILVQGSQDLEHGQHLSYDRPYGRVCKVSPGTHASTESIRDVFDVVRCKRPIIVEESFGYERTRIRVPGFVVCHRPGQKKISRSASEEGRAR
jgi:hypothetical protein